MAIPSDIVERYRKVCNLHQRGATPGERDTAGRIRASMEAKHPGLRASASASASDRRGHEAFTGHAPTGAPPTWRDVVDGVQDFLRDAAERIREDHEANEDDLDRLMYDCVRVSSRVREGKVTITVTIAADDLSDVLTATEAYGSDALGERIGVAVAEEFAGVMQELRCEAPRPQRGRGERNR